MGAGGGLGFVHSLVPPVSRSAFESLLSLFQVLEGGGINKTEKDSLPIGSDSVLRGGKTTETRQVPDAGEHPSSEGIVCVDGEGSRQPGGGRRLI